jgi:ribonuclease P protein component
MLPKSSRLTKLTIEKHLLKARRIKTPLFVFSYVSLLGATRAQISVSVSKKVAPKAVLRNKLRRRAYSALVPLMASLSKTTAGLVSYTSKDTKITIPLLTKEFEQAFKQAKILIK